MLTLPGFDNGQKMRSKADWYSSHTVAYTLCPEQTYSRESVKCGVKATLFTVE